MLLYTTDLIGMLLRIAFDDDKKKTYPQELQSVHKITVRRVMQTWRQSDKDFESDAIFNENVVLIRALSRDQGKKVKAVS